MTMSFAHPTDFVPLSSLTPTETLTEFKRQHRVEQTWSTRYSRRNEALGAFIERLREAIEEASVDGWDGPGSKKADVGAIEGAIILLQNLPSDFPLPDPSFSTDGELLLEWWKAKDISLAASLNSKKRLSYAAYIRGNRSHGSFDISSGELPEEFSVAAKRWWTTN